MPSHQTDIGHATNRRLLRATRSLALALLSLAMLPMLARPEPSEAAIDLDLYGRLLNEYTRAVSDPAGTRVDYRGLQKSQAWKQLVTQLGAARPSRLERDSKLAFWINAYNILAIELVLRHYPVESIKDIGSFFFPVWDKQVARIEGDSITLGGIEHEILRPMGEPRIHAAIICASTSCPPLARKPFRSDRLEQDLSAATRAWLASPKKGIEIDRERGIVTLSRIFDWFDEDFEAFGGPLRWIAPFMNEDDAAWLLREGPTASIRYFEYDWSLNDSPDRN